MSPVQHKALSRTVHNFQCNKVFCFEINMCYKMKQYDIGRLFLSFKQYIRFCKITPVTYSSLESRSSIIIS